MSITEYFAEQYKKREQMYKGLITKVNKKPMTDKQNEVSLENWEKKILQPNIDLYRTWDDNKLVEYIESMYELDEDKVVEFKTNLRYIVRFDGFITESFEENELEKSKLNKLINQSIN